MSKLTFAKKLALSLGVFKPANSLYRLLNQAELARFQQEKLFYSKLLPSNSLCFDIGANVGKKTEVFLELGCSVVAFEPQVDCVREIKVRCKKFSDRLRICQAVVGEQAGEATLFLKEASGQSSLINDWPGKLTGSMQVSMITLDRAIEQYGKPYYCKIDVEGFNLQVLQGLTQLIPLISFEYHLRERELKTTYSSLDYLSNFGEILINLVPSHSMEFAFENWMRLDKFLNEFPKSFQNKEGYFYGDIFVKYSLAR